MIEASRFLASKGLDEAGWLEARRGGVTATQVARASTPKGFEAEVASWSSPEPVDDNPFMRFGRDAESGIAMWLKDRFDVLPTDWVLCHETVREFMASPDGLSVDHLRIAEIKTTGKPWEDYKSAPIGYRRQIQWQLFVTGAESCVFAWMLRSEVGGELVAGWFEPRVEVVGVDPSMRADLVGTAEWLLEAREAFELGLETL